MEHISDYLGLRKEEAEVLLSQKGIDYDIHITAPPRIEQEGFLRVVKQEQAADGRLILTVCAIPDAFENV